MTIRRVAAVAGIVLAVAGCGEDGNDAYGGRIPAGSSGTVDEEPQIQVVAVSGAAEDGAHGSGTSSEPVHEESADDEMVETGDASTDQDAGSGHDVGGTDDGPARDTAEPDQDHADEVADGTNPDGGGNVVQVAMFDFGYALDRETVPVGEPVTFRFVNEGQIEHEAMFGSMHQQEEFASTDGHGDHGSEGHHGEIAAITLDAATAGEMVMVFDSLGEVLIGCHLPGHWDAGMVATLEVVAA
jgi:uncharacterized cupredoxin-like copper-binding protein